MNAIILAIYILGGAVFGSFLLSLLSRVHAEKKLLQVRSECELCNTTIAWYDLVPIASYIILARKCRQCKTILPWTYLFAEIGFATVFGLLGAWHIFQDFSDPWIVARDITALLFLGILFLSDSVYGRIVNAIVWLGTILAFGFTWRLYWLSPEQMLLGMVAGIIFFGGQYIVTSGKGIGAGEILFALFMGALLGWPNILIAIGIGYVIGAIVSLLLIALHKMNDQGTVPLVVYLSIGTMITLLWGDAILQAIL